MLARTRQRGDTLIEVLFAFSILSMVIVGALAIMNQGSSAAQRALETTLVRQEIDSQAATLRFLHDAYVANYQSGLTYPATTPAGQWSLMVNTLTASAASTFGAPDTCPTPPSGSFILDGSNAKFKAGNNTGILVKASTFAQIGYDATSGALLNAQGIWIEGIRSPVETDANRQNTRYIDFHIRACWESPGRGAPMTIGTIVRLYEPRG